MKHAWILDEVIKGHRVQCTRLVRELSNEVSKDIVKVPITCELFSAMCCGSLHEKSSKLR
jgi:hypothetical protein